MQCHSLIFVIAMQQTISVLTSHITYCLCFRLRKNFKWFRLRDRSNLLEIRRKGLDFALRYYLLKFIKFIKFIRIAFRLLIFYPLFLLVRSWSAFSCKLHCLLLLLLLRYCRSNQIVQINFGLRPELRPEFWSKTKCLMSLMSLEKFMQSGLRPDFGLLELSLILFQVT